MDLQIEGIREQTCERLQLLWLNRALSKKHNCQSEKQKLAPFRHVNRTAGIGDSSAWREGVHRNSTRAP